ncbi:MAG: hypothetical protein H6861_03110 [Rhodospirillales bacterium]|nr:hypothetical protein [Rhodospirillales bacterium]
MLDVETKAAINNTIAQEIERRKEEKTLCLAAVVFESATPRPVFSLVREGGDEVQRYAFKCLAETGSDTALSLLCDLAGNNKRVSEENQLYAAGLLLESANPNGLNSAIKLATRRWVNNKALPAVKALVFKALMEDDSDAATQNLLYMAYEEHGVLHSFTDMLAERGDAVSLHRIMKIQRCGKNPSHYGRKGLPDWDYALEKLRSLAESGNDAAVSILASLETPKPHGELANNTPGM